MQGNSSFPTTHFTLLLVERDANQLEAILSGVDSSDDVLKRLFSYLKVQPNENYNPGQLQESASMFVEKLKANLSMIGANSLQSALTDKVVISAAEPSATELQEGIFEIIGDFVVDSLAQDPVKLHLLEAFYGLTRSYPIVWYLCQPWITSPLGFDEYFKLWSNGYIPTFDEQGNLHLSRIEV